MQDSRRDRPASQETPQRPRDAATLIIIDQQQGSPRILFGKRRMDQKFMPGKYVFPGGRVDSTDMRIKVAQGLAATEVSKLGQRVKGQPSVSRLHAYALAAIRETFEETGLLIGTRSDMRSTSRSPVWQAYFQQGVVPTLGGITFIARAITPPGRPRRYDTRFFCIDAAGIADRIDKLDGELTELHWLTFDEAKGFDLPTIQVSILEDLADRLRAGPVAPSDHPVPFYHMRGGVYRRDLLTADPAS
jgi:8-oxo-dGTP pyrophosphatase MutT (NUDIX family)